MKQSGRVAALERRAGTVVSAEDRAFAESITDEELRAIADSDQLIRRRAPNPSRIVVYPRGWWEREPGADDCRSLDRI